MAGVVNGNSAARFLWIVLGALVVAVASALAASAVGPWQAASKAELVNLDRKNADEHTAIKSSIVGISDDVRVTKCYVVYPPKLNRRNEDTNTEARNQCVLDDQRRRRYAGDGK